MMKHTLLLLSVTLASNVLCRVADEEYEQNHAYKRTKREESVLEGLITSGRRSSYEEDDEPYRDEDELNIVGDIIVDPDEPNPEKAATSIGAGRYAEMQPIPIFSWHMKIWMSREIPYVILFNGKDSDFIETSLQRLAGNMKPCLSFRSKRSSDKWWLEFFYGNGCFSGIGRKYWKTGPTRISLGQNCLYNDIIQHEILHALGFLHEQSRVDRDRYVKIMWKSIVPGMDSQFKKSRVTDTHYFGTPYDYQSIMHYKKKAFAIRGKGNTMEKIKDPNYKLGNTVMSLIDKRELKAMYHCQQAHDGWSSWTSTPCMCTSDNTFCTQSKVRICLGKKTCKGTQQQYGTQHISKKCYPKDACEDDANYAKDCGSWATSGECEKNAAWMTKYCCLTCGGTTNTCSDNGKYAKLCVMWAKQGECKKNPSWMLINCCKSCR